LSEDNESEGNDPTHNHGVGKWEAKGPGDLYRLLRRTLFVLSGGEDRDRSRCGVGRCRWRILRLSMYSRGPPSTEAQKQSSQEHRCHPTLQWLLPRNPWRSHTPTSALTYAFRPPIHRRLRSLKAFHFGTRHLGWSLSSRAPLKVPYAGMG